MIARTCRYIARILFRIAARYDREALLLRNYRQTQYELALTKSRLEGLEAAYDSQPPAPLDAPEYLRRLAAAQREVN